MEQLNKMNSVRVADRIEEEASDVEDWISLKILERLGWEGTQNQLYAV